MNITSTFPAKLWCALGLLAALPLALPSPCVASPPPVPVLYRDLYNTLSSDLGAFNQTLNGLWNGSTYPVEFGGNLSNVDADTGPQLLNGGPYAGGVLELQELKAMGVQAVVVQVGFPILYPPFYDFLATLPGFQNLTYSQFVSFYQQVAQNVRAAGLKLVVEDNSLLSNDAQAGWAAAVKPYYATLNWTQFQAARAQCALNVAQTMQPDYLVVLEEPNAEAQQTGQSNVDTPSGAASLVSQILTALQPVRSTLQVGAGVQTYLNGFQSFIQSYLTLPLDYIDMHIYAVNNMGPPSNTNFLTNALTIASMAQAAGKPVTISEAWLWKMRNIEFGVLSASQIRARDPFSFWAPLDAEFLQIIQNLANYEQMLYTVPEGPDYLFTYQTYTTALANLPPAQILSQEVTLANQAIQTAAYTSTGMSYYHDLVQPPDTMAPSTPTILTANSGSPTNASLSWTAATDNVGVAGYYVIRDGVKIANTTETQFVDSGLTGGTAYTYTLESFDLARNTSPPASVTITTR
jgi:hypothetical protein